jgi:predicted nucleotidyltransferase
VLRSGMTAHASPGILESVRAAARHAQGLELLMLFGSRARDEAHAGSDWDFGYLATPAADVTRLLSTLVEITGSDRVDLVDLARAGGVLRFRAARDGQVLYERAPGLGNTFRLEAAHFWCDMAPVFGPAHADVLARLDR